MYKLYDLKVKNAIKRRSGTDGFQPKFWVDNKKYFLKVQCKLAGIYMNDWRVEDIASRICEIFNFYAVKQEPVKVRLDKGPNVDLYGVRSLNFENEGIQYKSFEYLLNNQEETLNQNLEFNNLSNIDKMYWIAKKINLLTNGQITEKQYLNYLIKLAIVDIFVCNVDRHPRNFGIGFNSNINKCVIPPIFDCGMGLFENDPWFHSITDWKVCVDRCYIDPYGEDPFVLLEELNKAFNVREKLKVYKDKLEIDSRLFPSKKAYQYFREVKRLVA